MYMKPTTYHGTTTSGKQPRQNKYDNNGKGWYFRFDDDNKMRYEYITTIIQISVRQFDT